MAQGGGYWISPDGKIVAVPLHITAIIDNPQMFGYTEEQLREEFEKHGEPYGSEGKAREKILRDVMRRGWIRLREWLGRRGEFISAQTSRITNQVKEKLVDFADLYIAQKIPGARGDKYLPVKVQGLQDGYNKSFTMQEISDFKMWNESEQHIARKVILEHVTYEDFIRTDVSKDTRNVVRRIIQ